MATGTIFFKPTTQKLNLTPALTHEASVTLLLFGLLRRLGRCRGRHQGILGMIVSCCAIAISTLLAVVLLFLLGFIVVPLEVQVNTQYIPVNENRPCITCQISARFKKALKAKLVTLYTLG